MKLGLNAYRPVREGLDSAANDEPLDAVAGEFFDGANEEDDGGGETVWGEAGEDAECFSDVFGDGEAVELQLSESHERFEGVGVVREGVIVAGNRLNPDGGDKAGPFPAGDAGESFTPMAECGKYFFGNDFKVLNFGTCCEDGIENCR